MTIGVDIRVLCKGIHTGVEEYTINLLSHLIGLAPHVKFKLFSSSFKHLESDLFADDLKIESPNVKEYRFKIPNKILFPMCRFLNFPKIDRLIEGADVFFSPHFFIAPLSSKCKNIVTFHDLSFIRYPEFFSLRNNVWHRLQMNPKKQAQRADKIIAVSHSTKHDLVELFKIDSEKIEVIYSGIDPVFLNKNAVNEGVAQKYKLPSKFILFLGTLEPRKNVAGLIRAFEIINQDKNLSDFHLVIAGNIGWLSGEIFKSIGRSPARDKIHYIGPILSKERKAIYDHSSLFVYPSFFEGFGFPPLEAMACGIPVVTSNRSSLSEVVGDSALTVDPYKIEEISQAIKLLLNDQNLYNFYAQRGVERAGQFSWEKTARETLELLVK